MYIRSATLLPVAALAAVVSAAPSALEARTGGSSQCNTGPIQCCNNAYDSSSSAVNLLTGLLGIALPSVSGLVGLGCSPITAVGIGSGASCTAQTVCCTGNTFNGLINLGCSPINIVL